MCACISRRHLPRSSYRDTSGPNLRHQDAAIQEFRDTQNCSGQSLCARSNVPLDPSKYQESPLLFKRHTGQLAPNGPEPYIGFASLTGRPDLDSTNIFAQNSTRSTRTHHLLDSDPLHLICERFTRPIAPCNKRGHRIHDDMLYLNLLYRRADVSKSQNSAQPFRRWQTT